MNKPEKAAEPSMEEILASIRKIIAEEPIGSRPEPARRSPRPVLDQLAPVRDQAGPQVARSAVPSAETRHGNAQGKGAINTPIAGAINTPIAIDDPLADLVEQPAGETAGSAGTAAQGAPVPAAAPLAAAPPAEPRQRPSWLFSHPQAMPSASPVTGEHHELPRAGGPLPSPRDILRSPVRADTEPVTVGDKPGALPADASAALKFPGRESALQMSEPDGGRGVPPITGTESSRSPRSAEAVTADATRTLVHGFGAPICSTEPESTSPLRRGPERAATESTRPDALMPHRSETVGSAAGAGLSALVAGSAVVEGVDNGTSTANSALDALAQGLAASAVTTGKAIDSAARSQAGMQASQAVRTLEETVTDLLRPMLRQWLDANLPSIVEKALRVELAEDVKPGAKTGPL